MIFFWVGGGGEGGSTCWATSTQVLESGDICPVFQRQGKSPPPFVCRVPCVRWIPYTYLLRSVTFVVGLWVARMCVCVCVCMCV